ERTRGGLERREKTERSGEIGARAVRARAGWFEAHVPSELAALPRALLEVATGGAPIRVDGAGVRARGGAHLDAGAGVRGGEGELPEVPGDQAREDVLAIVQSPADEVLFGDEDPTVARLAAARPAAEAVELVGIGRGHRPRREHGGRGRAGCGGGGAGRGAERGERLRRVRRGPVRGGGG